MGKETVPRNNEDNATTHSKCSQGLTKAKSNPRIGGGRGKQIFVFESKEMVTDSFALQQFARSNGNKKERARHKRKGKSLSDKM